jgi:hypothetical protein
MQARASEEPSVYELTVDVKIESKAKILKYIPIKSFVAREPFQIKFLFQNKSKDVFFQ